MLILYLEKHRCYLRRKKTFVKCFESIRVYFPHNVTMFPGSSSTTRKSNLQTFLQPLCLCLLNSGIYIYRYIYIYCQPTRIGLQGEFVSEIPRLEFLQKSNSCSKSRPYCISQRGALPTSKNMVNSSSILMNNQILLEPYTKPPFPPFTLTHLPPPDTGFISGSPRLSARK